MEKLKKLLNKLFCLPLPLVAVMAVVSAVLLIYSFAYEDAIAYVAYFAYFFSAYSLTCVCFIAPRAYKRLKAFKQENKYIQLYSSDARLRVKLSLYGSVAMNTAYALFQLGMGFYYHSVWFYALCGYYALLAIMRFFLLKDTLRVVTGQEKQAEWRRYRFCGALLVAMNITLAVIVAYIVHQNRGFEHGEIVTITLAAYTFTAVTMAIINIVKYRKYESPLFSAAKAISLTAALVSLLSLETSMLTAFGDGETALFRQIITASTGGVVCLLVLAMASYMIIRSTKELEKIGDKESEKQL